MKQLGCIIVEDEYPARLLLQSYIESEPRLNLYESFRDPAVALRFLKDHPVDIIFLDIQMPTMTGLEFIRKLEVLPAIILTTAYQQYAFEGYQLEVIDYLLKPFTQERFKRSVNRAAKWLGNSEDEARAVRIIKSGHQLHKVRYDSIRYIEGMREYVRYHTTDEQVMELIALKALEEILPAPMFKRVHKSYIVNYKFVTSLQQGHLELGNEKIPIGLTYRDEIIQWFKIN